MIIRSCFNLLLCFHFMVREQLAVEGGGIPTFIGIGIRGYLKKLSKVVLFDFWLFGYTSTTFTELHVKDDVYAQFEIPFKSILARPNKTKQSWQNKRQAQPYLQMIYKYTQTYEF